MFREQEKLVILTTLQRRLGVDAPWIGLYLYGEAAPAGVRNRFHDHTRSQAALY